MIVLTDVATKLEEILNSEDCPTDFSFVVKSQGYHLDSIANKKKGINLIPVFLTMVGGEYNPVPNLKQANFTYGVDIWFPVRFKETFYRLNEYLENVFVGKKLEIGGKVALCNIGVAEYGEIVGVHLDQFEEWVEETFVGSVHLFKKEHDISEEYMNMHFNIFATVLGDGFMFGNDVKLILTYGSYTLNNPAFDNGTVQSNTEEDGEQVLNATIKEVSGAPQITSYGSGFQLYYDSNSDFCVALLKDWCDGKSQDIEINCKYIFREADTTATPQISEIAFTRTCYIKSVNIPIIKGEPLSFTFGFAKKVSE